MILFITLSDTCQSATGFSLYSLTDEDGTDFTSLISPDTVYFSKHELCEEISQKCGIPANEIILEEV